MGEHVFGYVIIDKPAEYTWGKVYASKGGAKSSYNNHFNNGWREDAHSFDEQDEWIIRPLVLGEIE